MSWRPSAIPPHPMADNNAAENLEGLTLDSGWHVGPRVQKPPGATGGFFSVCYRVTRDGEECFLKAFNFAQFLNLATQHGHHRQIVDVVGDMIEAYKYERDLSALCKHNHVTKVAFVKDAGEQIVSGYPITVVPYLIFDVADGGDVRSQLSFASTLESTWKLRSLHSVPSAVKAFRVSLSMPMPQMNAMLILIEGQGAPAQRVSKSCPSRPRRHQSERRTQPERSPRSLPPTGPRAR